MTDVRDLVERLHELEEERRQLMGRLEYRMGGVIIAKVIQTEGPMGEAIPKVNLGNCGLSLEQAGELGEWLCRLGAGEEVKEEELIEEHQGLAERCMAMEEALNILRIDLENAVKYALADGDSQRAGLFKLRIDQIDAALQGESIETKEEELTKEEG